MSERSPRTDLGILPAARGGFIDGASNFHPYECGGGCVHCERTVSDSHDPATCELCDPEYDFAPNPRWRKKSEEEA